MRAALREQKRQEAIQRKAEERRLLERAGLAQFLQKPKGREVHLFGRSGINPHGPWPGHARARERRRGDG